MMKHSRIGMIEITRNGSQPSPNGSFIEIVAYDLGRTEYLFIRYAIQLDELGLETERVLFDIRIITKRKGE